MLKIMKKYSCQGPMKWPLSPISNKIEFNWKCLRNYKLRVDRVREDNKYNRINRLSRYWASTRYRAIQVPTLYEDMPKLEEGPIKGIEYYEKFSSFVNWCSVHLQRTFRPWSLLCGWKYRTAAGHRVDEPTSTSSEGLKCHLLQDWAEEEGRQLAKVLAGGFPDVFREDLWKCKTKAQLLVKQGTRPIFCRQRKIPFAREEAVNAELELMQSWYTATIKELGRIFAQ